MFFKVNLSGWKKVTSLGFLVLLIIGAMACTAEPQIIERTVVVEKEVEKVVEKEVPVEVEKVVEKEVVKEVPVEVERWWRRKW